MIILVDEELITSIIRVLDIMMLLFDSQYVLPFDKLPSPEVYDKGLDWILIVQALDAIKDEVYQCQVAVGVRLERPKEVRKVGMIKVCSTN